ncbi:type II secretion system protein GspL [Steroidobacter agaridevorans]|uniref:type II secretion system protein GspL n=1 Tax=Steroidobacter agaridevorans TaxID=2695856 RepID=UPI00132A864B|nr:type II secretion system protein GspL [Steroidobacter agaridevorans]GFE86646.1 type II secretion system protein L [Steroidobacter agaridevorans]
MPELLVVRLHPIAAASPGGSQAAPQAEWLIVDGAGARRGNVSWGSLSDAAALSQARKTVVLVPGTDVLLAEPVLPLKSGAKLAQVVPFALEEQLAADVEDMHFAVGKRESRPGTPVVAVSRARMDEWVATLQAAGLSTDTIYAETSVLPTVTGAVAVLIDGKRLYVRRENQPGTVIEVEPLIEALQMALASGEESREHVTIFVSEEDYERERELLEGLREFTASLQLKLLPDGPLPLLASNIPKTGAVNLLQGPYAAKTKLNISFAPWRYAAILAGVFIAAHLGMKTWQYFHYKSVESQLDAQIAEVFQQALPGAPVPDPLEARRQVEAILGQLRGTGPTSGMLTTLAMLSEAMSQAPNIDVEALYYQQDGTDLRVLAPKDETAVLDRILQVANERGIRGEIKSTNPRDQKIEGRLRFQKAGA